MTNYNIFGNTYPPDGSPPQHFSIDLDNHSSSQSTVRNAPWLSDTATYGGQGGPNVNRAGSGTSNDRVAGSGGYGYDPFSGFHWASNVIESPVTDPNYQGEYFYYGAQEGGRTLIEPAMIGGHWASQLGTLTPTHLELSMQSDGQTYGVTSTYNLNKLKGMNVGNNSFTYGPNGFQWQTISPQLNTLMQQHGFDTITNAVSGNISSNNLVPTQVSLVSQYHTPDGNNYTVVKALNPGVASSSATAAPNINLTAAQQNAVYVVTSSPIDYTKTFDPFQLYTAVMNSPDVSDDDKSTFSQAVNMTTGDSGSGNYPAFVAAFLSYGITPTLSGDEIDPNGSGGYQYTNLPAGFWDAMSRNHDTIEDVIHSGAVGGAPSYMYSCFLPGALIRTEEGDKLIESLQVGDCVCVGDAEGGLVGTRPVTRVLKHHVCVETGRSSSFSGWPILIVKDAFSTGVPSQDLRVTAEHCFYFDGHFVPARMLVNGKTIRYDERCKEYDYYHVELDSHDVIWANNTLTESWLDTDTFFQQGVDGAWRPVPEDYELFQGPTVDMSSCRRLEWERDSAFPLAVERSFVEPLYRKLEARAVLLQRYSVEHISGTLGAAQKDDGKESGVYLELEDGRRISPMKKRGRFLYFPIPDEAGSALWLCSNVSQPSEVEGPFVDDRRYLGRLIGMISLWEGGQEMALTDHLTSDHLPGWFKREAGPYRWTNGHAVLRLPKRQPSTLTRKYTLVLEVVAGDCTEQETADGQKVLAE